MNEVAGVPAHGPRGWDCHAHLFGPYDRFPLAADRAYTPPEALEAQYLGLLSRLGLSHGVLVHPSAYAEDHSLLLQALDARPNLRGVIVTRPGGRPRLQGLRERGVRAARFSHRSGVGGNFPGSASLADLLDLAAPLADAGLHAELWTDCKAFVQIADQLAALPLPVVVDHMGGFDVDAGVDEPGFRTLLSLLARGRIHVKLCAYRNLLGKPDLGAGRPFHQAMLEANPDGLVWGSDWPHLRVTPAPDALDLLQVFKDWTGDDELVEQILWRNPTALYD
jgi:predicted TIM-barrel fold metal-dependent hydrolase